MTQVACTTDLLDGEIFYFLSEAKIAIESWRRHYNAVRSHGSLGYNPPARGFRASILRAGGCAISTNSTARAGSEADNALTFRLAPLVGADRL